MHSRRIFFFMVMTVFLSAGHLHSAERLPLGTYTPDQFRDYWYDQGAELSRFKLQQARYGEIHEGDAVLVFVTEPMNPAIQVKADHPSPQNIPVIKLNAVRKFFTGIYPYSMMSSIFSPVDTARFPLPLKITTSVQEWCGHVYAQMNLRDDSYHVRVHSYFEEEGDQDFTLHNDMPEDAIWTMLRIAPEALPLGTFSMIPGTAYARLAHRPLAPRQAQAVLEPAEGESLEGNPLVRYVIHFPEEMRTLRLVFEKDFPYRLQQWEESYPAASGRDAAIITTRATRTHTIMNAYWEHHGNEDRALLRKLGLATREMGGH